MINKPSLTVSGAGHPNRPWSYLLGFIPLAGEHFANCESSVVLFMNSLWGACGNGDERQPIDTISLGCPHYHIDEVHRIAEFLNGRSIHPDTVVHIWTAGPFKYMAVNPGGYPPGARTAAFDAAKQRMSAAQETDARLYYGSLAQCLQTAISGIWEGA